MSSFRIVEVASGRVHQPVCRVAPTCGRRNGPINSERRLNGSQPARIGDEPPAPSAIPAANPLPAFTELAPGRVRGKLLLQPPTTMLG